LVADDGIAVSTAAIATLQAPTKTGQQYEEKLILEGKWGTGPGEFGGVYDMPDCGMDFMPTDININSKGEMYILDPVNTRIQKFDKDGKYILSIPIECLTDENGNSVVRKAIHADTGTNVSKMPSTVADELIINDKDVLYYSMIRNFWTKNKKNEVWEIRNDKVVKKYTDLHFGHVEIGEDGSLWMTWGPMGKIAPAPDGHTPDEYYNIIEGKHFTENDFNDRGHPIDYSKLNKETADRLHKRGVKGVMHTKKHTDYLQKGYIIKIDSKKGVKIYKKIKIGEGVNAVK
jgi:hypothetical protein